MTDFQDVGRQWARMCKSFRLLPNGCSECPLVDEHCYHESPFALDFDRIEYAVMQWAEENPEPEYPTWMKWLTGVGAIPKVISWDEPLVEAVYDTLQNRIPAELAEKLGIEPKEG